MKIIQLLKCENNDQWQRRMLGLGDDGITYEVDNSGHWVEFIPAASKAVQESPSVRMNNKLHEELAFVGFTNGAQILYANDATGEGLFFKDTQNDCFIPLYMLKTHGHRIESTTNGNVTLDMIKAAQKTAT